jgi:hypothetical protein
MFSYARKSDFIHLEDIRPSSGLSAAYKRFRNRKAHWVAECLAEAVRARDQHGASASWLIHPQFGTALFCYGGGSAQAGFIIGNILGIPGFGCERFIALEGALADLSQRSSPSASATALASHSPL